MLITGPDHANHLCDELSKMAILPTEKPSGGIFSRIKSSIFASHESNIRSPFVASCSIRSSNRSERDNFFCIRADGRCSLLKPVFQSSPPSATEITSLLLPASSTTYTISSIYLGSRQGNLVSVGLDSDRIILISVHDDSVQISKSFTVPVTVQITNLYLNARDGLVELFLVLAESEIIVIPDITKSKKYSFVYTAMTGLKIKQLEISTMTEESLTLAFENRMKMKLSCPSPIQASIFPVMNTKEEFISQVIFEKIIEIFIFKFPQTEISKNKRTDTLRRVKTAFGQEKQIYSEIILNEIEYLIKSFHLDSEFPKITSIENGIVQYSNFRICKIIQIKSALEKFVLTFLAAPISFSQLNQKLSRDSIFELFSGDKIWLSVFACCSVGEAVMAGVPVEVMDGAGLVRVVTERLHNLPSEVSGHITSAMERTGM